MLANIATAPRFDGDSRRPSFYEHHRAVMLRWERLRATLPAQQLLCIAHQGLADGEVADAVRSHREGILTLSGAVGGGKTSGAVWACYENPGRSLWCNAADFHALSKDKGKREELNREIERATLIVVDDIGAPGTEETWEAAAVLATLRKVLDQVAYGAKAILSDNMGRDAFAVWEGAPSTASGRMVDRLSQAPNRWIELETEAVSRRRDEERFPPPPRGLGPRELASEQFMGDVGMCEADHVAPAVVLRLGRALGFDGVDAIDAEHRRQNDYRKACGAHLKPLRLVESGEPPKEHKDDLTRVREQAAMVWLWRDLQERAQDGDTSARGLLSAAWKGIGHG